MLTERMQQLAGIPLDEDIENGRVVIERKSGKPTFVNIKTINEIMKVHKRESKRRGLTDKTVVSIADGGFSAKIIPVHQTRYSNKYKRGVFEVIQSIIGSDGTQFSIIFAWKRIREKEYTDYSYWQVENVTFQIED